MWQANILNATGIFLFSILRILNILKVYCTTLMFIEVLSHIMCLKLKPSYELDKSEINPMNIFSSVIIV